MAIHFHVKSQRGQIYLQIRSEKHSGSDRIRIHNTAKDIPALGFLFEPHIRRCNTIFLT